MRKFLIAALALSLAASAARAQVCSERATIGQFDLTFEGATFDGSSTEFEYCITGLDDPALSHWDLTLDSACIDPEDLVACSPEPCDYQLEDPTTGITGIKWDDLEVDPGETECYTFSLDGDWTGQLGDVEVGLKAGQGIHYGDLCGPVCRTCQSSVEVFAPAGGTATYSVRLVHRRPRTVRTWVQYSLFNERGRRIGRWYSEPFSLAYGDVFESSGAFPLRRGLRPGVYRFQIALRGMSNWITRETTFVVSR